jgi:hypothetical protein
MLKIGRRETRFLRKWEILAGDSGGPPRETEIPRFLRVADQSDSLSANAPKPFEDECHILQAEVSDA